MFDNQIPWLYTHRTAMPNWSREDGENPLIIPSDPPLDSGRSCPKCGCREWNGKMTIAGVINTCSNKDCRAEWGGSINRAPHDPSIPMPPQQSPQRDFVRSRHPDARNGIRELIRRPDPTPDFRKGAPIRTEEE